MQAFLLRYGGSVVTMIAALFGIFTADKKSRWVTGLAVAGVLAGTAFACWSAYEQDQEHAAEVKQTVASINTNTDNDVMALREELVKQGVLHERAVNATKGDAEALIEANQVATTYIQKAAPSLRSDLTIWLFPHVQQDVDFATVRARLEKIAGTVVEHAPVLRQPEVKTNSVWWSAGSNLEEAKAAALTVTSAGVQIQQICPSQHVPVRNLIQIGGAARAQRLPVLSAEAIAALTSPVCADHAE